MYLLLLSMSAHLTKELGMAPGGEFRRAFREAHSVPGCLVHLGDRPISITLKRALGSLSIWQKLKLGFNILTSKDSITKEDVEKCKQKDLLESMLEEMAGNSSGVFKYRLFTWRNNFKKTYRNPCCCLIIFKSCKYQPKYQYASSFSGEFPALSRVFVQERDLYLAHSLKLAANRPFGHHSPSVEYSVADSILEEPVVVGVVGIGHVPGIVENWETVKPEDVARVVVIPPMSATERLTRIGIRLSFAMIALYAGYRVFRNPISKTISIMQTTINCQ